MVVPAEGERDALAFFVNRQRPADLVLRLYVNDVTPDEADDVSRYVEASGYGYQSRVLRGSAWSAPSGNAPAEITYPEQVFTFTGPLGEVYGYYLTRGTPARLEGAERFTNGPYRIEHAAHQIEIALRLTGANAEATE